MHNRSREQVTPDRELRTYAFDEIQNAIEYETVITIMAPAHDIYEFWRDFSNLPKFMKHLDSIQIESSHFSHWKWRALLDQTEVEWDCEIIAEIPDQLIAWRSLEGSTVAHMGEVTFKQISFGRGTEVRIHFVYHPPGGVVTDFVETILGESPQRILHSDLMRLRELIEVGIIPTTEGQPRGGMDETLNPSLHNHH